MIKEEGTEKNMIIRCIKENTNEFDDEDFEDLMNRNINRPIKKKNEKKIPEENDEDNMLPQPIPKKNNNIIHEADKEDEISQARNKKKNHVQVQLHNYNEVQYDDEEDNKNKKKNVNNPPNPNNNGNIVILDIFLNLMDILKVLNTSFIITMKFKSFPKKIFIK